MRRLQAYITEHYYRCTPEILKGLGAMYAAGGEFTESIDAAGGQGDQLRARMNLESSSSKFSTTRSAQGCAAVTGFSLR